MYLELLSEAWHFSLTDLDYLEESEVLLFYYWEELMHIPAFQCLWDKVETSFKTYCDHTPDLESALELIDVPATLRMIAVDRWEFYRERGLPIEMWTPDDGDWRIPFAPLKREGSLSRRR